MPQGRESGQRKSKGMAQRQGWAYRVCRTSGKPGRLEQISERLTSQQRVASGCCFHRVYTGFVRSFFLWKVIGFLFIADTKYPSKVIHCEKKIHLWKHKRNGAQCTNNRDGRLSWEQCLQEGERQPSALDLSAGAAVDWSLQVHNSES